MHWPWSPQQNEHNTKSMARLREWYRWLRFLSWLNIFISLCIIVTAVSYGHPVLVLFVTFGAGFIHRMLRTFIDDIHDCAQDVVVYGGRPKFKHKI